jgi:pyrroline-5-carboxylate reductase
MSKVLLVGCGHMGSALIMSWLNLKSYSFTIVDPYNFNKLKNKFKPKKIEILNKPPTQKQMKIFDIIIFAVKPQIATNVLNDYENFELKKNIVIGSIIAGKKINFFKKRIKNTNQFVRIMPNMPALIRNGISCFVSRSNLSLNNKKKINELFLQVGKTVWLKSENQIDKATAVSGSGPGYIFTLIHAFEKAAQKLGFSKSQSRDLISSTMLGSILLIQETRKEPNELAKEIAVKGGTTEAGIKNLQNNNIDKIIFKTYISAYNRAKVLGKKN